MGQSQLSLWGPCPGRLLLSFLPNLPLTRLYALGACLEKKSMLSRASRPGGTRSRSCAGLLFCRWGDRSTRSSGLQLLDPQPEGGWGGDVGRGHSQRSPVCGTLEHRGNGDGQHSFQCPRTLLLTQMQPGVGLGAGLAVPGVIVGKGECQDIGIIYSRWGWSSVVKHWPTMCEELSSNPSPSHRFKAKSQPPSACVLAKDIPGCRGQLVSAYVAPKAPV